MWFNVFYRRPRLTVLLLGLIGVAGLAALGSLPRQEDPALTGRFATVTTFFPGASGARVEALVTEKIENILEEIEEIRDIISTSRTGVSVIEVELENTVDAAAADEVWSRVRDKLVDVEPLLPAAAATPEFERLYPIAFTLLVGFTWTLDAAPQLDLLYRLAKELEQRLSPLSGTRETDIFGAPAEEILVEIDPLTLASVNLTAADVSQAITRADAKLPAGQLRGASNELIIEVSGELDSVERIRQVPLRREADGHFLRVGDIAIVTKTLRRPLATLALVDGEPGVVVGAKMETKRRVDVWAAQARAVYQEFAATLPTGVKAEIIFDQSGYTQERLGNLVQNLALGVSLVVLVLLVMMGWKSALLVAASLPLSIALVLAGFNVLGIPLHQISITGLIISLGLLIDNAIVSVNEYDKERSRGLAPAAAIATTVRRLYIPLLASTVTTALTFLPIVLQPGPSGEFVGSIGVAVILSIFASFFLALTVIPALAGLFDRNAPTRPGLWRHGFSHPGLLVGYERVLDTMLRRPWSGILVGLTLPVLGFIVSTQLTEQFFPPVDRAQFQLQMSLSPAASLAETRRQVERARQILHAHPEVRSSHWFLGENPPRVYYNTITQQEGVSSFAGAFVNTVSPRATRALLRPLQQELMDAFPNAQMLALPFEQGPPFEAPVEIRISGPELTELQRLGEELRALMDQSPYITYTQAKITGGRPKLLLLPDEDEARLAGFQLVDLATQLDAALEGVTGGTVLEDTEELPVRVRVGQADRSDLARVATNTLLPPQRPPESSEMMPGVPLSVLTRVELVPEINAIHRRQGVRTNTVQAYVKPFVLPGKALAAVRERLAASDFQLPPGYTLSYGGETAESSEAQSDLAGVLAPLLVLMLGALVLAFDSFRLAGIIALVAVQSVGLALLTLWIFDYPMGFMAIVGTMGLVGLAINDSIVVLSALNREVGARAGDLRAIRTVVVDGTRHVVSTTLTTIGGFLPLILFGGTFWPPLATAIAGGLVGATLLALSFTPAAFAYVVLWRGKRSIERRLVVEGTAN